jgi:iron-sulfur cluster assembly protein
MKHMITITENAAKRIAALIAARASAPEALLLSVKTKGCSGLSYDLQYLEKASDAPKFADEIVVEGTRIFVDPKASFFLVGTIMDYKDDGLSAGFDFINPNETGRCGCGESFTVDKNLSLS